MNKQTEEMAKVIYDEFGTMVVAEADATAIAVHLTRNSYRKSTDVAREIFEELETFLDRSVLDAIAFSCGFLRREQFEEDYAELKKKYESEGADDD